MNALKLLGTYNSSESDDDIQEEPEKNYKKLKRLPLPDVFSATELKNVPVPVEKNQDGKIRNFPHEPGIWATHVHLPVSPFAEFLDYIEDIRCLLQPLQLNIVDDFHISLTRTVILKHHWIQDFTVLVKKYLSDVHEFQVFFSDLKVYVNEQKTRTFLSLKAHDNSGQLSDIVDKLDVCLKEYNLEPFYGDPSFHLSLLWCTGDECETLRTSIKALPSKLCSFRFQMKMTHCICVSGNKIFRFNFL